MSSITNELDDRGDLDPHDIESGGSDYENVKLDDYDAAPSPANAALVNSSRRVVRSYEEDGFFQKLYNSARNSTIVVKVLGAPSPYSQRRQIDSNSSQPSMNEAEAKGSQRGFFIIGLIAFVFVAVIALMVMLWK